MKVLPIFCLIFLLAGFASADTYCQDVAYAHKPLLVEGRLIIVELVGDFDDRIFTQDEHIEEIECIPEDDITQRNILYKEASTS